MRLAALFSFFLVLAMCSARPSDKKEIPESDKISTQKRETIETQDFGELLGKQKALKAAKRQPGPLWEKSFIPSKKHQHLWGSRELDDDQSNGLWGRSLDGEHGSGLRRRSQHNGLWGRSLQSGLWGRSLQSGLWGRSLQNGLWGRSLQSGLWGRSLQNGLWGRSLGSHHGLWGRSQHGLWGRSLKDQHGLWGRSLKDQHGLWGRSVDAADSGVHGLWGRSIKGSKFDKSSRSHIPTNVGMWDKRYGPTKIGVWGRALNKDDVPSDSRHVLWGKRSINEASKMASSSEVADAKAND